MKFTLKTLFSKFVSTIISENACQGGAIDWCKKTDREGLTFGEAIEMYLADDEAKSGWAVWNLIKFDSDFNGDVKKGFIKKIKDPMTALQLFRRLKHLTEEEDNILKNKFEGKLPRAEKELKDGVIRREKEKKNVNY